MCLFPLPRRERQRIYPLWPPFRASQNVLKRCDRLFRELLATLSWLWFGSCTVLIDCYAFRHRLTGARI